MANMFKNYFKDTLNLNDYLKIMKTAPEGEKYCNAKCQKFLAQEEFYEGKYNCKICYNQIIKARKMIDNNQLTFEQFLENPLLVEREETIIPVYRTCKTCEKELTLDHFESYRKECILCRRGKKKKNYEEEFKKYIPGIEAAKADIPALSNLIKGMSADLLKLTVKHYGIGMSHEDRVKDKMVVKIVEFFRAQLNPFICLGTCGNTLTVQFSVCDRCKKTKKSTAEEKMIEFEKSLDSVIENLSEKREDYNKYNKKQISMIATKLELKFFKTWDKTVIIDHILKHLIKEREAEEKESKQALINLGGEINLNGIIVLSREDGYINATQMCKAGGKLFGNWYKTDSTKELIETLEVDLNSTIADVTFRISAIDIKKGGNDKKNQGSWIHPDLAVQLAQWISPKFAIQVSRWVRELALNGKVEIGNEKTNEQLFQLQNDYKKLEIKHRSLLEKKNYYKFKKGECFYIISDMDGKSIKNKPGFEGVDIDVRLQQHRSTTPACKLEYLIYSKDAKLVETAILKKFENKKRNFKNHEWLFDVDVDHLIKSVRIIMDILGIEYEEEKDIAKYNRQIEMDFQK
jgi:hypothetical protein